MERKIELPDAALASILLEVGIFKPLIQAITGVNDVAHILGEQGVRMMFTNLIEVLNVSEPDKYAVPTPEKIVECFKALALVYGVAL